MSEKNQKILYFLGDSITDAGHLWEGRGDCLGDGYVRKISEKLDRTKFRCINKGQDGFTSRDLLRLVRRERFSEETEGITILIGVNDLSVWKYSNAEWLQKEYEPNLDEILRVLREDFPGTILLAEPFLFPKPDELSHLFPGLREEHRILQQMAERWKCEYLPLQNMFEKLTEQYGQEKISPDGIHLTEWGNRKLAEQWLDAWNAVNR